MIWNVCGELCRIKMVSFLQDNALHDWFIDFDFHTNKSYWQAIVIRTEQFYGYKRIRQIAFVS